MDDFIQCGRAFRNWFETFDPAECSPVQVADALHGLTELQTPGLDERPNRPRFRPFKPNEEWQRNRRKAMRLGVDGYRTGVLPNDDGSPSTMCSLAYDLCDFYEFLTKAKVDQLSKYLSDRSWPYVQLRIRACEQALRVNAAPKIDPFARFQLRGRFLRFVSWRSSEWTHASEDPETERGATTLCGGREAFHRHTHQQWSCFWCTECERALSGKRPTRDEVLDYLLGRTPPGKRLDLS